MELATNPELAAEITLQPLRRYPLDAAIIFSDILTIPDAMGLGLRFEPGVGPVFEKPLSHERDFLSLEKPDVPSQLSYVMEAIRLAKKGLAGKAPLIGFSGSPFTLACYMVEGQGSKNFLKTKSFLFQRPALMHMLLKKLSETIVEYLTLQVEAGADVLQIFDTWGGLLATPDFKAFSLEYTSYIVQSLRESPATADTPIIVFTKGAPVAWYHLYEEAGISALGVDWRHELPDVARTLSEKTVLQGNLDPLSLLGCDQHIIEQTQEILDGMSQVATPHIFNLGHGMDKNVEPEKVALLVETVHSYSAELRK